MIIIQQKPFEQILEMTKDYRSLLIVGCDECASVVQVGGERQAETLKMLLEMARKLKGDELKAESLSITRQCDKGIVFSSLHQIIDKYEAILCLGCGAGVQAVSELFPEVPVIPALNTEFLGETKKQGIWIESCVGCGDCMLYYFGGICPLTRCSKHLLNGPCGGSVNGKCEIDPEIPCAWQQIIDRLSFFKALYRLESIYPPKDWSKKQGKGPRKIIREDQLK